MSTQEKRKFSEIQKKNDDVLRTDEISNNTTKRDAFTDSILNQQVELHKRVFPNKSTKEIIEYQSNLLKQRANANLEGHRMLYEFQRQSVKTALDAVLMQGKQKVISETNSSFLNQMEEMASNLLSIVNRNEKSLEAEFLNLDNMKIPEMRETKRELLLELNGRFHVEMVELLDRYKKIKDELV
jgi:hypothetical protein